MPHVEVLPNSTSISAPGWAYVPDTGFDPSKVAIQPSGARKRNARVAGLAGGDNSLKQNNAVLKRIADLDKDNFKDVQIPVPSKKEVGGRPPKGKTAGTRKILLAQRTFAMYVNDEEALAAQEQPRASNLSMRGRSSAQILRPATASSVTDLNPHVLAVPGQDPGDVLLLQSAVPAAPSDVLMDALCSAPPLPFNEARAGSSSSGKPQRYFCELCGYWGRAKCISCGARVCGLVCKTAHDEDRCQKYPG